MLWISVKIVAWAGVFLIVSSTALQLIDADDPVLFVTFAAFTLYCLQGLGKSVLEFWRTD